MENQNKQVKGKRSKYSAKKTEIDGIVFDSKIESQFYLYLKELKSTDKISDFSLQPKFELVPTFKKNGRTNRAITYTADFEITLKDGNVIIVDTKGMETDVFKIKRKLFDWYYPERRLYIVAYDRKTKSWIDADTLKSKKRTKK